MKTLVVGKPKTGKTSFVLNNIHSLNKTTLCILDDLLITSRIQVSLEEYEKIEGNKLLFGRTNYAMLHYFLDNNKIGECNNLIIDLNLQLESIIKLIAYFEHNRCSINTLFVTTSAFNIITNVNCDSFFDRVVLFI